ncbi:DNA-binding protein [Romboutsia sp. CE17]|uniref:DNA-binding protein n=1 Tax=Romboutsia sp. CE17 TaxID=2724150 RepID=UPI001442BDAA|nr:DNA-binding protein [Romboutsia sp. CE17]QJA08789.1 DNA-binding protein [Romboutsia sp. CE17]
MEVNERLEAFLKLQSKNISFDNISKEIGIKPTTLRRFLNKMGYKSENGIYISTNEDKSTKSNTKTRNNKTTLNSNKTNKKNTQITFDQIEEKTKKVTSKAKLKRDKKINITQEDLDKLCEVYDWYLEVKDYKSMKPKRNSRKKDIVIEDLESKEFKSTSIKVEKNTWQEFERLCSNSEFSKQQIITQALKDFMKEYKHLL